MSDSELMLEVQALAATLSIDPRPPADDDLALFRAIFEHAPDAMLLADDGGRLVDGNAAGLALLGLDALALRRSRVHDFGAPGADADATWAEFLRTGHKLGCFDVLRPDGTVRAVEVCATARVQPGRHLIVLRDVSEERRARDEQARLAGLLDHIEDAISAGDLTGHLTYWSPSSERLYGWTAAEAIGRHVSFLIPPEERGVDPIIDQVRRGGSLIQREGVRVRKDGSRFVASVTYAPIRRGAEVVGVNAVTRDITEKRRLHEQLALSERLATAGTLAAGVAHEINNPLAAVIANLDMIVGELVGYDDVAEPLADAREAAGRIAEIVRDLRFLAHPDDARRAPLDVGTVLRTTVRLAAAEIRARARLVEDYQPLPPVRGNAARLGQLFVQLVINATRAIAEGAADENEIAIATRTDAAGRAVITIRDTGAGIPAEHLPRIFDPFFTTRAPRDGTGLGLAICHRLVTELGGEIHVRSSVGRGSEFEVVLPPDGAGAAATPGPAGDRSGTARRRVLVIDDEPIVGRAVARALKADHDIVAVTGAQEALDRLRAGERYDVVLCDLMMPHMTGMELHEHLAASAPDVARRMIFFTGGAYTPAARDFVERMAGRCLEKPFDAAKLRALLR